MASTYAVDIISSAENEIGYTEKASNSMLREKKDNQGMSNYTKYGYDFDNTYSDWYDIKVNKVIGWSHIFIEYLFVNKYGVSIAKDLLCKHSLPCKGYILNESYEAFTSADRFSTEPMIGDIVFLTEDDDVLNHTGLVISIDSDTIYTIEGDITDMVVARSYPRLASYIKGYGHPRYSVNDNPSQLRIHMAPVVESWNTDEDTRYNVLDIEADMITNTETDSEGREHITYTPISSIHIENVVGELDWGDNVNKSGLGSINFSSNIKLPNGSYDVVISNKHAIKSLVSTEHLYDEFGNMQADIASFAGMGQLKTLKLGNAAIYGDIGNLTGLSEIADLELYNTNITGDIASLRGYTELKILDLHGTDVYGNYEETIPKLEKLRDFNIDSTNVSGDNTGTSLLEDLELYEVSDNTVKSDLGNLGGLMHKKLRYVYTSDNFKGNIKIFSTCPTIEDVYFNRGDVTGDIDTFATDKVEKLERVGFHDCPIYGDIGCFMEYQRQRIIGLLMQIPGENDPLPAEKTRDEVISDIMSEIEKYPTINDIGISGTDIAGNIEGLSGFRTLNYLNIYEGNIAGDIGKLTTSLFPDPSIKLEDGDSILDKFTEIANKMKKTDENGNTSMPSPDSLMKMFGGLPLVSLSIVKNSKITGSLSFFKEISSITDLILDKVDGISGTTSDLSNLYACETMVLHYIDITGDIAEFKKLKSLKTLSISNAKITGDISVLRNLENLERISFYNCDIGGDAESLASLPNLKQLYLFQTKCYGNLKAFNKSNEEFDGLALLTSKFRGKWDDLRNKDDLSTLYCSHQNTEQNWV